MTPGDQPRGCQGWLGIGGFFAGPAVPILPGPGAVFGERDCL